MADEQVPLPKVEQVDFEGRFIGTPKDVLDKVSQLPFYSSKIISDAVVMARVESRNINKRPYLFHIISMRKQGVELIYSIPPDTSETLRRAFALKSLMAVGLMVRPVYQMDEFKFMQYIDSVMDSLISGLSQNYNALYNKYDSILNEYRDTKRLNVEISSSNRTLTIKTAELNEENKSLKEQLQKLQKYSDEALMVLVEEWLRVHNGSIDMEEFAKTYSVMITRVEQIIDKMVSMGYIELRN
ncbi:MAG: hypothetical protein KGH72_03215 [Candidatus Micrarchaeota archaeon]|nr:hypothetical protein [Candidatus Micrarchaeota archaeon]